MPTFNHITRSELNIALRERYRNAIGQKAANIAEYFNSRPSTELQTAFGISLAQVTALKTRMTTLINRRNSLTSGRGE